MYQRPPIHSRNKILVKHKNLNFYEPEYFINQNLQASVNHEGMFHKSSINFIREVGGYLKYQPNLKITYS